MLAPVTFLTSVVLSGVLMVVLQHARVLDVPNSRSSHHTPTPRGGGLAVMVAVTFALAVVGSDVDWVLVVAALLLSLVGLADDLLSLPARVRLVAQFVVTALFAGGLLASADAKDVLVMGLGILIAVAYINAFNFMDGVNGISALQATLAGAWSMWLGTVYGIPELVAIGTALAAASLGFLPWNAGGRIFLGDVGSYGMGSLIALFTLAAWSEGVPALVAGAPLIVYLADTGWVLVKRTRAGEPLMTPHRDHVYQQLVRQGWPHLASAAWSTVAASGCCLVIVFVWDSAPALVYLLLAVIALIYLSTPQMWHRLFGSGEVLT